MAIGRCNRSYDLVCDELFILVVNGVVHDDWLQPLFFCLENYNQSQQLVIRPVACTALIMQKNTSVTGLIIIGANHHSTVRVFFRDAKYSRNYFAS